MGGESDDDLPLHDEAKARSKWRGDESLPGDLDLGTSGPASEVDNAAQGEGPGGAKADDSLLKDLAQRPPD
ncbi:MAG TPA: hypothetical protein VF548_06535 [Allosphingosinicella sp.]|jgi:hypothetical protein